MKHDLRETFDRLDHYATLAFINVQTGKLVQAMADISEANTLTLRIYKMIKRDKDEQETTPDG